MCVMVGLFLGCTEQVDIEDILEIFNEFMLSLGIIGDFSIDEVYSFLIYRTFTLATSILHMLRLLIL